ncbi:uncharacterized protein METZ01_LOCUS145030 [marine metagenome]|uniref:Uncharacterized protein n=1 Tax=marine metagenome TaxID=408172 RepID=A0A381ZSG8_9ZZZZ
MMRFMVDLKIRNKKTWNETIIFPEQNQIDFV